MKFLAYKPEYGEKCFRSIAITVKDYLYHLEHLRNVLYKNPGNLSLLSEIQMHIYATLRFLNTPITAFSKFDNEIFTDYELELINWAKNIYKGIDVAIELDKKLKQM